MKSIKTFFKQIVFEHFSSKLCKFVGDSDSYEGDLLNWTKFTMILSGRKDYYKKYFNVYRFIFLLTSQNVQASDHQNGVACTSWPPALSCKAPASLLASIA